MLTELLVQVVLVKDAEATLCGTWERCLAFEAAMGRAVPGATSVGGGMGDAGGGLVRRPLVLLAGCGFSDSANQSASQARCFASKSTCLLDQSDSLPSSIALRGVNQLVCGFFAETEEGCSWSLQQPIGRGREGCQRQHRVPSRRR